MEWYREYPIRCKTCNEPLAVHSPHYEALISQNYSQREALDFLGITLYCSRIAMMNPTIVMFDMENRAVIEGYEDVDASGSEDPKMVFGQCIGDPKQVQEAPMLLGFRSTKKATVPKPSPKTKQSPKTAEEAKQPMKSFLGTTRKPIKNEEIILPDLIPNENEYISITAPIIEKTEPVLVGVPVINHDPTVPAVLLNVGAGKQIRILNGRTYLAR